MDSINTNQQIRTEKRFHLIISYFRIGGIPLHMKNVSKVSYLYNVIAVTSFYVTYIGSFLDVTVNIHERDHPMYSVRVCYGLSLAVFIHISISVSKYKIEQLIQLTESFIWEDLPDRDPKTGQLTQAGLLKMIKTIVKNATILLFLFHIIQSGYRIITQRDIILNVWFPFDVYSSPIYELFLISQVFASIVSILMICAFMVLYPTMVIIACSQLEKLKTKLSEVRFSNTNSVQFKDVDNQGDENSTQIHHRKEHFVIMHRKLKECVKFHQQILEYMEILEDSMNLALGGLLLLNLGGLCVYAFSSVTNWGDVADVSQGVAGYILFTLNVYVVCITGAELTKEAQSIRYAAWDCDWIGAPLTFQKSIMFIIARANKEFTLTAAKFVPVSMVTFMNIMQQTMSYFMFLLEMKNRNNDK